MSDKVYIGRPTKWGNPYKIGRDGTREQVIALYREYAEAEFTREELMSLDGKELQCYCKPRPCHGDVLAFLVWNAGGQVKGVSRV